MLHWTTRRRSRCPAAHQGGSARILAMLAALLLIAGCIGSQHQGSPTAQADDWNKTAVKLLQLRMAPPDWQAVEKMRSFAAAVQLSPEPTVRATFESR